MDKVKDVLTTGQVAKLCGVAPRTVCIWIDKGMLPGYRIPGKGQHRRVVREDLLSFLHKHGMPVPF